MKTQEEGGAMIPYERQIQLLQLLEENDFMSTEQLVNALEGVSESTVRRDLKALSDDGQIVLMRGGASKVRGNSHDTPVDSKLILNTEVHCIICFKVIGKSIIYYDGNNILFFQWSIC